MFQKTKLLFFCCKNKYRFEIYIIFYINNFVLYYCPCISYFVRFNRQEFLKMLEALNLCVNLAFQTYSHYLVGYIRQQKLPGEIISIFIFTLYFFKCFKPHFLLNSIRLRPLHRTNTILEPVSDVMAYRSNLPNPFPRLNQLERMVAGLPDYIYIYTCISIYYRYQLFYRLFHIFNKRN